MMNLDWSSIILAVIGLVSSCGWLLDRKRHKQEVEGLRADNRLKEMNLSKDYVTEFRTYIAEPLQREVGELRQEVKELRNAIQRIDACTHRDSCPVIGELQRKSSRDA